MAILPLRTVRLPTATEQFYDGWLADLQAQLTAPGADWYRITRDLLFEILYPGGGDYDTLLQGPATPEATRLALLSLDPRNVTLEPEYYAEVDAERFARVKPLFWLWQGFDRLAAGAQRAPRHPLPASAGPAHLRPVGRNFKAFQYVEFSFGYNLEVGDDVVVHRNVLLDDRGGITLGDRVSISDYANIYSHTHSIAIRRTSPMRAPSSRTMGASPITPRCSPAYGWERMRWWEPTPSLPGMCVPIRERRHSRQIIRIKPNAPPEAYVTERVARRDIRES